MSDHTPTLDEIGALAGVSRMTVSRVLNNRPGVSPEIRETITRIASELGYVANRAARELASKANRALGLLCLRMEAPFVAEFVKGAVTTASSAGWEMLIYSVHDPNERPTPNLTKLLSRSTQGLISVLLDRQDYLAELAAVHFRMVALENPEGAMCTLVADNRGGAREAVRYLVELGHRRIAFITGPGSSSTHERRNAYEETLRRCGIQPDPALLEVGNNSPEAGLAAGLRLLALPSPPTAIFASNDCMASGVLEAARVTGVKVPERLSVVGFDDVPLATEVSPALTTVRQPIEQMGRTAVNTMLALLSGVDAAAPVIWFPTELVVRASTAPPWTPTPRRRR